MYTQHMYTCGDMMYPISYLHGHTFIYGTYVVLTPYIRSYIYCILHGWIKGYPYVENFGELSLISFGGSPGSCRSIVIRCTY